MVRRYGLAVSAAAAGAVLLSACSGGTVTGVASTTSVSSSTGASSSSTAAVPHSGAPKVTSPLPAKVLDGSPCDSALTSTQLTHFLGQTAPPKPSTDALGTACDWHNAGLNGSGFQISYQTKSQNGISLAYESVKPTASRWVDLAPIQGYPAIGYVAPGVDPTDKLSCVIVVGVTDELAYSVVLTLSDESAAQHKDACMLGPDVADAVMTNLKARA